MPSLYLIKDLARVSGYSVYTLKYYLKIGLIQEVDKSPETGYRFFDDTTVTKLRRIHAFRKEGKSIKEIQNELFQGSGT